MQQNIMPGPQHPVYQSPVKTFTNQAVIAFFLYWAFWLPGLIASMIWWFEANNVLKNSGIKPEGYTALLIEMVLGFIPALYHARGGCHTYGNWCWPSRCALEVTRQKE